MQEYKNDNRTSYVSAPDGQSLTYSMIAAGDAPFTSIHASSATTRPSASMQGNGFDALKTE
jgi:hypothetical protein